MERHRQRVLALAFRALGNADDAQDVAQEVLVYAVQRLPELRDSGKLAGWLRHLTLSLCADYRRRRGTRRLGEPLSVLHEAAAAQVNYAEAYTLRQAVRRLSPAHQTTFLLHYVGGWSREEVAAILGIPLNTVRSRLSAARRTLRADLPGFFPEAALLVKGKLMSTPMFGLSELQHSLLTVAFPNARVLSVQADIEPWMPFGPRVCLALPDGTEKAADFRGDIGPARAALLPILERLGIPSPRLLAGPVPRPATERKVESWNGADFLTLCEPPRGENLLLWALGGTPHRIRLATERAFEAIDLLQGITSALQADPAGAVLEQRTLADEAARLTDDARWDADPWLAAEGHARRSWLADPWFAGALEKVQAALPAVAAPLVYTHYSHFLPLSYRIAPASDVFAEPLGAPGDPAYQANPLVEVVNPFGHYGDPLLGLAMVWVYDCYPFVHTGFVEQFLWRRGVTRREFAPRLALTALQMIARDLPLERPAEGGTYWDSLHGWAKQGLEWMAG